MELSNVRFGVGTHEPTAEPTGDRDMCIMEAVAFFAGEPWSDHPACTSPVVSRFVQAWNDSLSDEDRDRLIPAEKWVPRLVGSRSDDATEERRAFLALDWLVRVHTPAWLDLVPELAEHAATLRGLPEVVDAASTEAASVASGPALGAVMESLEATRTAFLERNDSRRVGKLVWGAKFCAAGACASIWGVEDMKGIKGILRLSYIYSFASGAAIQSGADLKPLIGPFQQSALDLLDRMLSCGQK